MVIFTFEVILGNHFDATTGNVIIELGIFKHMNDKDIQLMITREITHEVLHKVLWENTDERTCTLLDIIDGPNGISIPTTSTKKEFDAMLAKYGFYYCTKEEIYERYKRVGML